MSTSSPSPAPRAVRTWLSAVFLMIVVMTMVGGITRLTGSGLSMVVWHPLMGAIPPLSHEDWQRVFDLYKQTPQYQQVNDWMQLADFQRIFFWEYLHRLIGRSIGLVVLLPWLWFLARRQLSRKLAGQTVIMLLLGGSQGLLGWYMVKSGLVDEPRVSHFRLAAHLLLAFTVAQYVLWVRLSLSPRRGDERRVGAGVRALLVGLFALVFVQSAWGAFMAGTHAGHFASTFPDVNGHWLPQAFASGNTSLLWAMVDEVGPIHATHRLLGWTVGLVGGLTVGVLARTRAPQLTGITCLLLALLTVQVLLGILTVVMGVPISIAVAHQVGALLLLSTVTAALERARRG